MLKARVAVLVSGGGTNLQALFDAQDAGILSAGHIELVLSSKAGVRALERANGRGVKTEVVEDAGGSGKFDERVLSALEANNIDVVVLAGFLHILGEPVISRYCDRIVNVHPSLIPSFCGKGYYGLKVHEAALAAGVKVTGATVHIVNEVPDGGRILLQKAVDVLPDDTPQTLQRRVMEQAEWILLPRAVEELCETVRSMK